MPAAPESPLGCGLKSCPDEDSDDLNGGKEVDGVLLEAGSDPAGVLEPVEEALDEIALSIQDFAVVAWHAPASGGRNAGPDAALAQERAQPVGIIGLVGNEAAVGRQDVDQRGHGCEIVRLPWRQSQPDRQSAAIDHGMDLGGQAAARAPDRFFTVFLGAAAC
jgi:hypothetical protein